jgi:hypothetical protein
MLQLPQGSILRFLPVRGCGNLCIERSPWAIPRPTLPRIKV